MINVLQTPSKLPMLQIEPRKLVVHLLTDCTVVAFSTDAHQPSFSHLWWHAWRSTGVIFLLYCMSKPQPPHPCDTGYVCPALSISCTDNHFQNIGYHVCPVLSIPCAENHLQNTGYLSSVVYLMYYLTITFKTMVIMSVHCFLYQVLTIISKTDIPPCHNVKLFSIVFLSLPLSLIAHSCCHNIF